MKNLNNIGLDPGKLIPQEQLIHLGGGVVEECTHVTCTEGVGEWYGVYETAGDLQNSIENYCGPGESAFIEQAYGLDCWGID